MAKNTYFATDGSYGDEDNLIVLDTSDWSDEKWELVRQMTDSERYAFADEERFAKINEDMLSLES